MSLSRRLAEHLRQHPLSVRLLATILAFSSLFTLLGTAAQLFWEYRTDLGGIEAILQQVEVSHLQSLTTSQWMFDEEQVERQLEGIVALAEVDRVELRAEEGDGTLVVGADTTGRHVERTYALVHLHRGEPTQVGTLRVVASLDRVYARLRDKFLVILGTQGLRTFATSLFILFIVQFLITRHLETLAEFGDGLSLGKLSRPLFLDRESQGVWRPDELDRVEGALEGMRQRLVRELRSLEAGREEREGLIRDLEAKNEEMERFAFTVSHDLKSPLITIQSFLGLVRRDIERGRTDRIDDDLQRISSASRTMFGLLDDLLALSRAGKLVGDPTEIPLDELLDEVAELVSGPREQSGVQLDIDSNLPQVSGDRSRLRTVFQNLIENSIKFIGDTDTPRITVRAREAVEMAVIEVRDNGIGLEPERASQVFDLFRQEDIDAEGSGIGLALVHRIVTVHGGKVWVESDGPGTGCCFVLTLPLAGTEPGTTGSAAPSAS